MRPPTSRPGENAAHHIGSRSLARALMRSGADAGCPPADPARGTGRTSGPHGEDD